MKLLDIIKNVGAGVITSVVPGGGLILDAVNAFLPEGKKLPSTATGSDLGSAVASLPAAQRTSLLEKQFDAEITQIRESYETIRAMLDSDAKNPQSTRPYIAKHSFHVIALVVIAVIALWSYAVGSENIEMTQAVMDGWPFVLAVVAPFVVLLRAYFGILKNESANRLDAANKHPTTSLLSLFKRGK